MIRTGTYAVLEAVNREGKSFFIGSLVPTNQFSDDQLKEMESRAQKVVEDFGIRKRSPSKNWRAVFSSMNRYPGEPLGCMDHAERFIGYDGEPIIISQPYLLAKAGDRMDKVDEVLESFADKHGMEYIRRDDLSYHYPGRTTLLVWRRKRKETVNQQETMTAQEAE